jgi:hypothetical protein
VTSERLIYALWGPLEVRPAAYREVIDAAWVQVNLDDDAVAGAQLRIALEEPIQGFVALPGDADIESVGTALDGLAVRHAGWRVETEIPIQPPTTADGARLDALANIAVLRRPTDQPYDEWLRAWKVLHTPVAIQTQATFGYLQNRVLEAVTPGAPEVAALVEEHFPMAALGDLHAFYGSGGDDAELARRMEQMMASIARFGADRDLDLVPTSRYLLP